MGRFTGSQRRRLLATARAALTSCLARGLSPSDAAHAAVQNALSTAASSLTGERQPLDAALLADAACFVTLWGGDQHRLRGCRGEFTAHQPLIQAVAHMALAAALDDPRFSPLTLAEVPHVRIEISVLTPPAPIQPTEVEIGKHGLLLMHGSRRGLLLPEVSVEHHLSLDQYLAALCDKAGLPPGAWLQPDASLWGFETEAWEEE